MRELARRELWPTAFSAAMGDGWPEDAAAHSNPVLRVDAGPWARLFANATRRVVSPGVVFSYVGPGHGLYYLERGRLRFYAISAQGTEKTYCVLAPGGVFGEENLVDPTPTRWLAAAERESVLRFIDAKTARVLASGNPELAWAVMEALVLRLKAVGKQLEDQVFRTVGGRLACLILSTSEETGPIRLTHDEIGRLIGSNRVSVTRALNELRRQGLVEYDRSLSRVVILDRTGLEAVAAEQL